MAILNGTFGNDRLFGTVNRDVIRGFGGDDLLGGGAGNDNLHGGYGADRLFGGDGDDILMASRGADFFEGGAGRDAVSYDYATFGVQIFGRGIFSHDFSRAPDFGQNWAVGHTFNNIEVYVLSQFNDRVVMEDYQATVHGGGGADYIIGAAKAFGGEGQDILEGTSVFGGNGHDQLTGVHAFGGPGNDRIDARFATGHAGADTFEFHDRQDHRTIRDFQPEQWDRIRFIETSNNTNFTFEDFDSMLAHTSAAGANTVIRWDGGLLTLDGVQKSDLQANWFIFDLV